MPEETNLNSWNAYIKDVARHCGKTGISLTINNSIPLGKGMGTSTAMLIAISRCLLGEDCEKEALLIEDKFSSGHSGIDFTVIWNACSVLFKKNEEPKQIKLPKNLLEHAILIDAGTPNETTPKLLAWIKERENDLKSPLKLIGECSERLTNGDELHKIIHDHHRAQIALGIVPEQVQTCIAKIEESGGNAKIIGAGGRTGGGGMVLALHKNPSSIATIAEKFSYHVIELNS